MREAQREADAVVARVVAAHAVRRMVEEVGEAQRVAVGVMIRETRADAPEEAVGAAVARMGVVVGEQAA